MKATLKNIAESKLSSGMLIILIALVFFYLRNGSEYFSGSSGGAYWDNMNYCKTHRDSQMKIYSQLVSCREIIAYQKYCRKRLDESIIIDGTNIPCDRFLGVEDDQSP